MVKVIRISIEINFNMAHITTGLITSLMVFILVMQGNVSRTIPEGAVSMASDFECHTDNNCPEKDTYCDVGLNLCSQCLNCSIYFRTPKKGIKCPKDISDCSACLDGYMEEIFFGGEIRDLCIPNDSNIILPTSAKISSNSPWQDAGIIFIITNTVLIFFLLWTYIYKRFWNISALQDSVENLPPPYNSCMKLDSYVTDNVQEFHLFTGEQPPRNEWRHQNAVPFRLPEDFLETDNCMDVNENLEEVDGVVVRDVEDPELHDEETMPSVWTPPSPPSPVPETMHIQNNNLQTCPPPSKRIRLSKDVQQSADQKNYQDEDTEDNASDMSQDE